MSRKLRWTRRALKRLDDVGRHIAADNPAAAKRIVGVIVASARRLSEKPSLGRPGRLAGTRELVIPRTKYIVAYRVCDNEVEILTVLHSAQQWPDAL